LDATFGALCDPRTHDEKRSSPALVVRFAGVAVQRLAEYGARFFQVLEDGVGLFLVVERVFFFSSRRRHTRLVSDWSSDVCSSDLGVVKRGPPTAHHAACGRPRRESGATGSRRA